MDVFAPFIEKIENPAHRSRTQEVLDWVSAHFPGLQPRIAWNQPMFTDHGTFIIGFSVARHHLAVAPEKEGIERFADAFRQAGYSFGSHLVRFEWKRPVDYPLLARMIEYNIEDKANCKTFWRRPDC